MQKDFSRSFWRTVRHALDKHRATDIEKIQCMTLSVEERIRDTHEIECKIRQFGSTDSSSPEGFRRYTIYEDSRVEELRRKYENEDVYLSVYRYESEDFDNCLLSGNFYLDLDDAKDPSVALVEIRKTIEILRKLGIPDEHIYVYWSGCKGFHVEVPIELFNGTPHRDLNLIWKTFAQMIDEHQQLTHIDWSIYDRRRLWRIANSRNSKTGLYKIPLSIQEVMTLSVDEIRKLAKESRPLPDRKAPSPLPNLETLWKEILYRIQLTPIETPEKREKPLTPYTGPDLPCIKAYLGLRLKEHEGRNNAAHLIYSYYLNFKGYTLEEAESILRDWNRKNPEPLGEDEIKAIMKSNQKKPYGYGCSHPLKQPYCNRAICPLIPKDFKIFDTRTVQSAEDLLKNGNLLKHAIETTNKWLVKDIALRKLLLREYVSAFTDDPSNLALLGRDSIGKTYNAVVMAKLLPESYIEFLAGQSPAALAHDLGEYDKETRSWIVDVTHKIWLMLDVLPQETMSRLKPLLSHDRSEIVYKFTDKTKRGGLRTQRVVIRGWPAVVLCAAKTGYISEYSTRWATATPEISESKTDEACGKIGEIEANPEEFMEDENVQVWRVIFTALKKNSPIRVKIPFGPLIAREFVKRGPETMRVVKTFMRMIKANAALHFMQRTKDGEYYVAELEDFKETLEDFKVIATPTFLGISGDALQVYNQIKGKKDLSFEGIAIAARQCFGCDVSDNTLRELYVQRMVESGLLLEKTDPNDKRRKLYDAVERASEIQIFKDEERLFSQIYENQAIVREKGGHSENALPQMSPVSQEYYSDMREGVQSGLGYPIKVGKKQIKEDEGETDKALRLSGVRKEVCYTCHVKKYQAMIRVGYARLLRSLTKDEKSTGVKCQDCGNPADIEVEV